MVSYREGIVPVSIVSGSAPGTMVDYGSRVGNKKKPILTFETKENSLRSMMTVGKHVNIDFGAEGDRRVPFTYESKSRLTLT